MSSNDAMILYHRPKIADKYSKQKLALGRLSDFYKPSKGSLFPVVDEKQVDLIWWSESVRAPESESGSSQRVRLAAPLSRGATNVRRVNEATNLTRRSTRCCW